MIVLVEPCERYLESYREAFAEYEANGVTEYGFSDGDIFRKFEDYRWEQNLKPNRVGADYYWLVDEEESYFIGEVSVRHDLNEALMLRGGHIGYGVRWGEWGKGYGTKMLSLALEKAKERRLERVLVTCDDGNAASARVMEKNGFVMEDKVEVVEAGRKVVTRRYWKSL